MPVITQDGLVIVDQDGLVATDENCCCDCNYTSCHIGCCTHQGCYCGINGVPEPPGSRCCHGDDCCGRGWLTSDNGCQVTEASCLDLNKSFGDLPINFEPPQDCDSFFGETGCAENFIASLP